MKKHFPGHFPQSKAQISKLWKSCFFVVDANILLNLYRYSDKTRREFLHVLNSIKKRLWLPHQAAAEFFANRLGVIGQQEKAYADTIQRIEELQQDLTSARQHPFVSETTMKRVNTVFKSLKSELDKNQKIHTKRITVDSIQTSVSGIFAGRVGASYDSERLAAVFSEGKSRYSEKIPPGFKDNNKAAGSERLSDLCRQYGDLLVWFQILERAEERSMSVILVTDDKKEDWWRIYKGRTVGPRPELVQEFLSKTKQSFHMYQADRFLELANEYLEQTTASATLSEIREVRRRDVEERQAQQNARGLRIDSHSQREMSALSDRLHLLKLERAMIVAQQVELSHKHETILETLPSDASESDRNERLMSVLQEMDKLKMQKSMIEKQFENLRNTQMHLQHALRDRDVLVQLELEQDRNP